MVSILHSTSAVSLTSPANRLGDAREISSNRCVAHCGVPEWGQTYHGADDNGPTTALGFGREFQGVDHSEYRSPSIAAWLAAIEHGAGTRAHSCSWTMSRGLDGPHLQQPHTNNKTLQRTKVRPALYIIVCRFTWFLRTTDTSVTRPVLRPRL